MPTLPFDIPPTIAGFPSTLVIGAVVGAALLWVFFRAIPRGLRRLRGRIMAMFLASSMLGATGGYTLDSVFSQVTGDTCGAGEVKVSAQQPGQWKSNSTCLPAHLLDVQKQ